MPALLLITLVTWWLAACDSTLNRAGSGSADTLPLQTEASGVVIRLTDVVTASDATIVRLELTLVERREVTQDTFLPITPERIETQGIGGDPQTFGSIRQYPVRDGWFPLEIRLGPIVDPAAGAAISLTSVGVLQPDGHTYKDVRGPWTFALSPALLSVDPVDVTIPVNAVLESPAAGLSVTIVQVRLSSRAVAVRYRIPEVTEGTVLPGDLTLRLPDGRILYGSGPGGRAPEGAERVVEFPPLPAGVRSFTLAFEPFVVAESGPVEVRFPVPEGFQTAEDGVKLPVGVIFELGDERLEVAWMMHQEGRILVEVVNADPSGGSVLLVGPDTSGQVLEDDHGRTYRALGGHLGMQKDETGHQHAGSSRIEFEGPLASDARVLTLRAKSYGRVVEINDTVLVTLPAR